MKNYEGPKQESDGPEEIRWIATLDDGEATPQACFETEHQGGEKKSPSQTTKDVREKPGAYGRYL